MKLRHKIMRKNIIHIEIILGKNVAKQTNQFASLRLTFA